MPFLLWDASALVKRYTPKTSSAMVAALFRAVPAAHFVTTLWGYSETFSILLRRFNGGIIRRESFLGATSALRSEVIESAESAVLTLDDSTILRSLSAMQAHNLNSTDAALLTLFLRYRDAVSEPCVLVAADQRFVRAASAEGLPAIDPEDFVVDNVRGFLSAL